MTQNHAQVKTFPGKKVSLPKLLCGDPNELNPRAVWFGSRQVAAASPGLVQNIGRSVGTCSLGGGELCSVCLVGRAEVSQPHKAPIVVFNPLTFLLATAGRGEWRQRPGPRSGGAARSGGPSARLACSGTALRDTGSIGLHGQVKRAAGGE